jgi:hypothetical protein
VEIQNTLETIFDALFSLSIPRFNSSRFCPVSPRLPSGVLGDLPEFTPRDGGHFEAELMLNQSNS